MIDETDAEILARLQEDARIPLSQVAEQIGLATSSVHERVRKLESKGIIRGYRPILDAEALNYGVTAIVQLSQIGGVNHDVDLHDRLAQFSEVEDCYGVAGEDDYILKVRTSSTRDLEVLLKRLNALPSVSRTRTTVILNTYFEHRPFPIRPHKRD